MKKLLFLNLLLIASMAYCQTKIDTTESGKKVLLKDDNTWQYLDKEMEFKNTCVVEKDIKSQMEY